MAAAEPPAGPPLPSWYDDAKLGIFIHWNAAAIPAFAPLTAPDLTFDPQTPLWRQRQQWRLMPYAEMYENAMLVPGSETQRFHAETYGERSYAAFAEEFRTRSIPAWEAEPWAELFASAGARYVVLTTKTEDGFLLWPSDRPHPRKPAWQSERDVVGELAGAVRAAGMRFGTYYCGGLDWSFGGLPIVDTASMHAALRAAPGYPEYARAHWDELVDRYAPSVLWNDYCAVAMPELEGFLDAYRRRVPDGVVNDRFDIPRQSDGRLHADFVTLEYAEVDGPADRKWEACRGIGTSFGYNRLEDDRTYLDAAALVHLLADVVAGGGNLLLNVGPDGAGRIPPAQAERLRALGAWLAVNGEAIHGTRRWQRARGVTNEGVGVRYTRSADAVHAIVLGPTRRAAVDLDVELAPGAQVTRAGGGGPLAWTRSPHGTCVELPAAQREEAGFSLRIAPAGAVADATA
ncbi:alpha-L-fucosidase [Conexibacter arvalis]|uniref:alpha-L-fucosidase n=1 Tax=Conexibacter arvalis TaxID=912552 RepID=A0A840I6M7_9ACTN|nr:alpha-L-fucosidase [Conexibacter arvalis]MBB4660507.1 alpha-L-fucosidase [Conexibacter arvalis]